jgi:predicted lipid carrier protein YhbT
MHRWDAQSAQGIAEPIETTIAHDGIDEFLDAIIQVVYASRKDQGILPAYGGERYHFHRSDGAGDWLVEFDAAGIHVERASGPADVSIGGPVSELLLFLYGRAGVDHLSVRGKREMVRRWPELVGTF